MTYKAGFKQRTHSNSGFTLLEVLVSLTMMALITAVAFTGLSIGIDAWRRGTQRIDQLDQRFATERLIEHQIGLADPASFNGDRHQLEFATSYSLANGPGDPVMVKYELDANTNQLKYSETPVVQYAAGQSGADTQILSGVLSTGFKYLYTMPNKEREWADQTPQQTVGNQKKETVFAVRIDLDGDMLNIPVENNR
jgi:prepilin-type N-terminal cleavage/methylation domain-containing protein